MTLSQPSVRALGAVALALALGMGLFATAHDAAQATVASGPSGPATTPVPTPVGTPSPGGSAAPINPASGSTRSLASQVREVVDTVGNAPFSDEARTQMARLLEDFQIEVDQARADLSARVRDFLTEFVKLGEPQTPAIAASSGLFAGNTPSDPAQILPTPTPRSAGALVSDGLGSIPLWIGALIVAAIAAVLFSIARSLRALLGEQRVANARASYESLQNFRAEYASLRVDQLMPLVAQLIADTTGNITTLREQTGILSLSAEPAPQFTVAGERGIEYVFTTDPAWVGKKLAKTRTVRSHVLANTKGHAGRARAQALWERAMSDRSPVVAPLSKDWYLVVSRPRGAAQG